MSAVVLNYNGAQDLGPCLRSLEPEREALHEVVVVDNASQDDSCNIVREEFPWVRLVASRVNLGCAGGRNLGWTHASGDIVFFLDSDARVAKGCIDALRAAFADDEGVGVIGCVVRDLEKPEHIQDAGISIDRYGFPIPWDRRDHDLRPFYVSGCSIAVRRELDKSLGMFDERFFIFEEEVDLCWRCQLAGLHVRVAPRAVVYHRGGTSFAGGPVRGTRYRTSAQRVYLRERNAMSTLIKNYSLARLALRLPVYILVLLAEFGMALVMLRWRWAMQYPRVLGWNLKNMRETLRLRRRVSEFRQVRDEELPFDKRFGKLLVLRSIGIPRVQS